MTAYDYESMIKDFDKEGVPNIIKNYDWDSFENENYILDDDENEDLFVNNKELPISFNGKKYKNFEHIKNLTAAALIKPASDAIGYDLSMATNNVLNDEKQEALIEDENRFNFGKPIENYEAYFWHEIGFAIYYQGKLYYRSHPNQFDYRPAPRLGGYTNNLEIIDKNFKGLTKDENDIEKPAPAIVIETGFDSNPFGLPQATPDFLPQLTYVLIQAK